LLVASRGGLGLHFWQAEVATLEMLSTSAAAGSDLPDASLVNRTFCCREVSVGQGARIPPL